jgi:two-component system, OmpR family, sensor histidine kinase KdpD
MSREITAPKAPLPKSAAADQRRGRLKVFLGMAAGVGKTFRMLLEGQAELQAGHDVVIGLLETHGAGHPRISAEAVSGHF